MKKVPPVKRAEDVKARVVILQQPFSALLCFFPKKKKKLFSGALTQEDQCLRAFTISEGEKNTHFVKAGVSRAHRDQASYSKGSED